MRTQQKLLTRFQVQEYLGIDRIKIFIYSKQGKLHPFNPSPNNGSGLYRSEEVKLLAKEKSSVPEVALSDKISWKDTTFSLNITVHIYSEEVWKKAGNGEGTYSLAKKLIQFDIKVAGELENVLTLLNTTTSQEEKELAICWLDRKGYGSKFLYQLLS